MEVLYQLSYPGARLTVASLAGTASVSVMATPEPTAARIERAGRRRAATIVPAIILASGLLFTGIGVALLLAVDPVLGVIFIAVGLTDALMGILFRGRLAAAAMKADRAAAERGKAAGEPAEQVSPEVGPSFNPYARED
jgi:hypothetical protein